MKRKVFLWSAMLAATVVVLLVGQELVLLRYAGEAAGALSQPTGLYLLFACVAVIAITLATGRALARNYLQPIDALSREIRTLLQTKQLDRPLKAPGRKNLGALPEAVAELADELRGARREVVRAMATATARVEQEKGWLEVVLLELVRESVLVCSSEHRILLYNRPAAKLFRTTEALGLGRSVFDVLAAEPIHHALERLQHRLEQGQRDLSTHFVCATPDARLMLNARIALTPDQAGRASGYVLTLEDISAELADLQREEAIRVAVTRELRNPVASLRAAVESLMAFPDLEDQERSRFLEVIHHECTALSERIEQLASFYQGVAEGHWPMTEIHSPDLFNCVARHVREQSGVQLAVAGSARWLRAESHALMLALEFLIKRIVVAMEVTEIEIEAGGGDSRSAIELRWQGRPVPQTTLRDWLTERFAGMPGGTVEKVLQQHGSEPWSHALGAGRAELRIPLQPASDPQTVDAEEALPPRPEYYDFDLMYAHSFTGDLGDRRLKDLSYIVFDTETTGLRPTAGDQIISIAAVRVTKGRVLTAETFEELVNPGRKIPKDSIRFHGISDDDVKDKPPITEVLPRFHAFAGDGVLVAHNAAFDIKFLKLREQEVGVTFSNPVVDTLLLSLLIEGDDEDHTLDGICERLDVRIENRHSAFGDALATAHVLVHLLDRLEAMNIRTFKEVMAASNMEAQLRFRSAHF